MKRVTGIGGVFFKAKDPDKLREWHRAHLGIESEKEGGAMFKWCEVDELKTERYTVWSPFPADTDYFAPSTKPFMINFQVTHRIVGAVARQQMKRFAALALILSNMAMAETKIDVHEPRVLYVPIGDSYSIGEGASPDESWPALLTQHLKKKGIPVDLVANPSRTGWTAQQAIDRELPIFREKQPNFATLQIGVNDWVQGVDEKAFRERLASLMDQMLGVLRDKNQLLIITIPDFGVTPTGPKYSRGRNISDGVASFNKVIAEESQKRSLRVVDVFELSKKMGRDRSLVAADGLHPSAKEYAEWEKTIFPAVLELLAPSPKSEVRNPK